MIRWEKSVTLAFAALSSRDEPTQLQAGVVSEAKNIRLDDGKATTRLDIPLK